MALAPAVTGVTLDPLPDGATSRLDRATAVRVNLDQGALASVTQVVLVAQAIAALIGTILTIYGRVRATTSLERRRVTMSL